MSQDVFVTGAVLGVNCSDLPLPFFSDIYTKIGSSLPKRQLIVG
jgi:hypothetical protein